MLCGYYVVVMVYSLAAQIGRLDVSQVATVLKLDFFQSLDRGFLQYGDRGLGICVGWD